jgi:hypothetical protein
LRFSSSFLLCQRRRRGGGGGHHHIILASFFFVFEGIVIFLHGHKRKEQKEAIASWESAAEHNSTLLLREIIKTKTKQKRSRKEKGEELENG